MIISIFGFVYTFLSSMRLSVIIITLLYSLYSVYSFRFTPKISRMKLLLRETINQPEVERTCILIKPDGVQRRLVGSIISRFEAKGFVLLGIKLTVPTIAAVEEHYGAHKDQPYFNKIVDFMSCGPVVVMVWKGKDIVKASRLMLGATNPLNSAPGTIRGDFAIDTGRNVCHGSDSVESAQREIALWFPEGLQDYNSHSDDWINE